MAYLSTEEYELVEKELGESGGQPSGGVSEGGAPGVFFLIQLEPDHDPGRFSFGFASSIDERLRSHRTSAPLCPVVATLPTRLLWEKTAIDSIARDCDRLHAEVFRAGSIAEKKARGDAFLAPMPDVL